MRSLLTTALAAAALAGATAASAQEIRFQQIPWTAPLDSVRAALGAAGYTYLGLRYDGHTFMRADSSQVTVVMRSTGRPLNFVVLDPSREAAMVPRFRALVDSLGGVLGRPVDSEPSRVRWEAGPTSALVRVGAVGGKLRLETVFRGPEWAETVGNGDGRDFRELAAGYVVLTRGGGMRLALDTSSIVTLREGHLRATYHVDLARVQLAGISSSYNAIEDEIDLDCAAGRARLHRHTMLWDARRVGSSGGQREWHAPAAGTDEARVMEAACRARGLVAAAAPAAQPHGSGAVPAGWVLIGQSSDGRSLLDSASVVAKGNEGVFAATVRTEFVPSRASPHGLYDGMEMRLEVDCPGQRVRTTAGKQQAGGRDLRSIPVPSSQARWSPGAGMTVVALVCRVAGATPR